MSVEQSSEFTDWDSPCVGLHYLKDNKEWKQWTQPGLIAEQCRSLRNQIAVAIGATYELAAMRTQGFFDLPNRTEVIQVAERQLEYDLLKEWGFSNLSPPSSERLWHVLIERQVPLFDNVGKDGWGHIDLLGLNRQGMPVVIELKVADSDDSPARGAFEAIAYSIGLRRVYVRFCDEAEKYLRKNGYPRPDMGDLTLCRQSQVIPSVLLAPSQYWKKWAAKNIPVEAWTEFSCLLSAFAAYGYPIEFAYLHGGYVHVLRHNQMPLFFRQLGDGVGQGGCR